jgi:UrcA family protein
MTITQNTALSRASRAWAAAVFGLAIYTSAAAQEAEIAPDIYAIRVPQLDTHPVTPAHTRQTLSRLGEAALAVCGASSGSLQEIRLAVRASPCWIHAMSDAVTRIGDPRLALAYRRTQ